MIEYARQGILGFELPEGWTYTYSDRMIACGPSPSGIGCSFRAEISDPNDPNRVFALTSASELATEFYRGSAGSGVYGRNYEDPNRPNQPVIVPSTEFDAYERAAWVIGHEVDGHINHQLPGTSSGELQSQYYGRRALQAWREYLRRSDDGY